MINEENIELYLFQYREGMLDDAECAALERAFAEHPEWRALADSYDPTLTLPAGATLAYEHADTLRNGGPKAAKRKGRVLPLWIPYSAAAAVLLAMGIGLWLHSNRNGAGEPMVAQMEPEALTTQTSTNDSLAFDEQIEQPVLHTFKTEPQHHTATIVVHETPQVVAEATTEILEEESMEPLPCLPDDNLELAQTDLPQTEPAREEEPVLDAPKQTQEVLYADNQPNGPESPTKRSDGTPATNEPSRAKRVADQLTTILSNGARIVARTQNLRDETEAALTFEEEQEEVNNRIFKSLLLSLL